MSKVIYRGGLRPSATIIDPSGVVAPIVAPYVAPPGTTGAVDVPTAYLASLLASSDWEAADSEAVSFVPSPREQYQEVFVRASDNALVDETRSVFVPYGVGASGVFRERLTARPATLAEGAPTVTINASASKPTIVLWNDSRIRVSGTVLSAGTGTYAGFGNTKARTDPIAWMPRRGGPTDRSNFYAFDFVTGLAEFEVLTMVHGGDRMRVCWNDGDGTGWHCEADATWSARLVAGARQRVTFPSAKAGRRVRIELASCVPGGIAVGASETISAPTTPSAGRAVVVSDSYGDGTISNNPSFGGGGSAGGIVGYAVEAAHLAGIDDVHLSGVGSTGYANPGTPTGGQDARFTLTLNGPTTAGTFKLTAKPPGGSSDIDSGTINYNDSAAAVQTACEPIYGAGNVTVTGSFPGNMTISLTGTHAKKRAELPTFTQLTALTGSTGSACAAAQNGGVRVKFADRFANDVAALSPDMIVWAGGLNDANVNAAFYSSPANALSEFRAQVNACFALGAATGAVQVALGPWQTTGTPSADLLAFRDQIKAAAAAYGVFFIDNITDGWISSGNVATMVGPDGTHASVVGMKNIGRRLAAALTTRGVLAAM